jgi:phytoene desaturase
MHKKISIIGGGLSGLSAACYLAKSGHQVDIYEKNNSLGGRARQIQTPDGYVFDMGPSWYWMHDVIENFFADFGKKSDQFYKLIALDPQFEMVFADGTVKVPKDFGDLIKLFDSLEAGAGVRLNAFMEDAKIKYDVSMTNYIEKPCLSITEFFTLDIFKSVMKLNLFSDFRSFVRKYFRHPKLIALMEFPVIFLGAAPQSIPALYSMMNYGGLVLGTKYPLGGFFKIIEAMQSIAQELGVKIHCNCSVNKMIIYNDQIKSIQVNENQIITDLVVASADYHHIESLLPKDCANYSEEYWDSRSLSPSTLIFYLGLDRPLPGLLHHTLFFEPSLDQHLDELYKESKWPSNPLFYVCCPSKTDRIVMPNNHENLFLLMPIPAGVSDKPDLHEYYFELMLKRIENHTGISDLKSHIDFKKSFSISDFIRDYNAFKGNAYGLANTLKQTAILKPSIINKKIKNLYYTGHLTVPGPGVPPSIISGKIVAKQILRTLD